MNPTQREDGPAIASLFARLEGEAPPPAPPPPGGTHLPPEAGLTPNVSTEQLASDEPMGDDEMTEEQRNGPMQYVARLHQAGEAAIQIVKNMVDAECAGGNPRNIPEPILGWYIMTMTYELCVLEACLAKYDQRKAHAEQLQYVRNVFKRYEGEYADGVREEVEEVLKTRFRPKGLDDEHADYRGVLK